jgi:hypothetical protein
MVICLVYNKQEIDVGQIALVFQISNLAIKLMRSEDPWVWGIPTLEGIPQVGDTIIPLGNPNIQNKKHSNLKF